MNSGSALVTGVIAFGTADGFINLNGVVDAHEFIFVGCRNTGSFAFRTEDLNKTLSDNADKRRSNHISGNTHINKTYNG
jgi:hypothetical protein